MSRALEHNDFAMRATEIIKAANGKIKGRTRLQKLAYILEACGLGEGFNFYYYHFGPYSEDLASSIQVANLLGYIKEAEKSTSWGGFYSIYTCAIASVKARDEKYDLKTRIATIAKDADPVELELAATVLFLYLEGVEDPWLEIEKRKPEKATTSRLKKASDLYNKFRQIKTPKPLPEIPAKRVEQVTAMRKPRVRGTLTATKPPAASPTAPGPERRPR
jgi:uncharacterized protein